MSKTYTVPDMLATKPCNELEKVLKEFYIITYKTNFTLKDIFYSAIPTSLGNRIWLILSLCSRDDLQSIVHSAIEKVHLDNVNKDIFTSFPEKRFLHYGFEALKLVDWYPTLKFHFLTDALMFLNHVDKIAFEQTVEILLD